MKKLLLFIFLIISCDQISNLSINKDKQLFYNKEFDCGYIKITSSLWAHRIVKTSIGYNKLLNKELRINKDSLKILYNNKLLPYEILPERTLENDTIKIFNNDYFIISFDVEYDLRSKKDTIYMIPTGFVYCEGKKVEIDTLKLFLGL